MRHLKPCPPLFATLLLPAAGSSQSALQGCTPAALDHVAIAVGSLDRAQLTYEELGFRLKPGRLHANGLGNTFAKFRGDSYLELRILAERSPGMPSTMLRTLLVRSRTSRR